MSLILFQCAVPARKMPVFPEIVAYDFPKHSNEAAEAKLILVPGGKCQKIDA